MTKTKTTQKQVQIVKKQAPWKTKAEEYQYKKKKLAAKIEEFIQIQGITGLNYLMSCLNNFGKSGVPIQQKFVAGAPQPKVGLDALCEEEGDMNSIASRYEGDNDIGGLAEGSPAELTPTQLKQMASLIGG